MATYGPKTQRWARGFCRDDHQADDVLQDNWMVCAAHLHELRHPEGFASWVFKIVKTQALRSLRRADSLSSMVPDFPTVPAVEDGVILRLDLKKAVDGLPVALSRVFVLIVLHDWPLRDADQFLNIPVGTVKSRLACARVIMKERLADHAVQLSDGNRAEPEHYSFCSISGWKTVPVA